VGEGSAGERKTAKTVQGQYKPIPCKKRKKHAPIAKEVFAVDRDLWETMEGEFSWGFLGHVITALCNDIRTIQKQRRVRKRGKFT